MRTLFVLASLLARIFHSKSRAYCLHLAFALYYLGHGRNHYERLAIVVTTITALMIASTELGGRYRSRSLGHKSAPLAHSPVVVLYCCHRLRTLTRGHLPSRCLLAGSDDHLSFVWIIGVRQGSRIIVDRQYLLWQITDTLLYLGIGNQACQPHTCAMLES